LGSQTHIKEHPMSDDLREREPLRDQMDFPPEEGTRSDQAGTGAGVTGPAPAGGDPERISQGPAGDEEPAQGMGATAGGGYGVAAERPSSGNSGDGQSTAGEDPQTEWLRHAEGGAQTEGR
jgi:hypothetical protein